MKHVNHNAMDNIFKYYQGKSLDEIKLIKPKWAYGRNRHKISDIILKDPETEYRVFYVKTVILISKSDFIDIDMSSLYTGKAKNDTRIARILYRWDNNLYVDPPSVGISNEDRTRVSYADGQHRSKLTFFLGVEDIPIAIHKEDISILKTILNF
jgi:hypothetical protein